MKKFSLIELLVVVAIIGILASLVLPSLSSAREKGKLASCKSNMKQLGFLYLMYMDDNDDYFMWSEDKIKWNDHLMDYLNYDLTDAQKEDHRGLKASLFGDTSLFGCPGDTAIPSYGGDLDRIKLSYSPSVLAGGDGAGGIYDNGRGITGSYNYGSGHVARSQNINDISSPSGTVSSFEFSSPDRMVGRDWWGHVAIGGTWGVEGHLDKLLHDGVEGANYLMVDGHVETLNLYKTLQTTNGSMGSFSDTTNTMWDSFK